MIRFTHKNNSSEIVFEFKEDVPHYLGERLYFGFRIGFMAENPQQEQALFEPCLRSFLSVRFFKKKDLWAKFSGVYD